MLIENTMLRWRFLNVYNFKAVALHTAQSSLPNLTIPIPII